MCGALSVIRARLDLLLLLVQELDSGHRLSDPDIVYDTVHKSSKYLNDLIADLFNDSITYELH